ncbi:DUF4250 domain-containing protein [Psychromonas aquatilis]|uniref:DUF4250 domain-containing protein n=1 Tax=Psychromonas aquatilis TaxID=2005072 RepID=A0ABU9GMB4_9GAMM
MLENYKKMDINMLFSIVNMKLRNENQSIADLCTTYDLDANTLTRRLKDNGFIYDPAHKQFKKA